MYYENCITISAKKIKFLGLDKFIIFTGMKLSPEGYSQDTNKIKSILDFSRLENCMSLECWLVMGTQFCIEMRLMEYNTPTFGHLLMLWRDTRQSSTCKYR